MIPSSRGGRWIGVWGEVGMRTEEEVSGRTERFAWAFGRRYGDNEDRIFSNAYIPTISLLRYLRGSFYTPVYTSERR